MSDWAWGVVALLAFGVVAAPLVARWLWSISTDYPESERPEPEMTASGGPGLSRSSTG